MNNPLNPEEYLQAIHLLAEHRTNSASLTQCLACYYAQQVEDLDRLEPRDFLAELTEAGIALEDL